MAGLKKLNTKLSGQKQKQFKVAYMFYVRAMSDRQNEQKTGGQLI